MARRRGRAEGGMGQGSGGRDGLCYRAIMLLGLEGVVLKSSEWVAGL